MSTLSSKKKNNNNNNNNNSSFYKIKLTHNQYNNYNVNKKSKEKINNINLETLNNKKLNNSSFNINEFSFYNFPKGIKHKTKRESNSQNKNKLFNKNDLSLSNNIKTYRNNYSQNNLNNTKTSFDFFKKRFNIINNKFNINNKNNNNNKSLDNLSKIKKNNNKDINQNKKNNKIKISNKYISNTSNDIKRTKTPIISSYMTKNSSKNKNISKSTNNSKEKKVNGNDIYKNKMLYSGTNLNIHKIIKKKNHNLKPNIRTKIFQSNNIFEQFKPKKKKKTLIHQEQMIMKKNFLISNLINLNKDNKENKKNNANYSNIQKSENNLKLKYEESNKDILPLTNNTIKENILNVNNYSKSNPNIISSSNIISQLNHNINNNKINNNDSNNQFQYLNINSAISLSTNINSNNNNNSLINIKNNSSLNIGQKQKQPFNGKKIKCIHEISKTGLAGIEKKINQDRDFIFRNFVEGFENIFMGVCDGHGYFGNEISEFIKENLPMDLNRIIKTHKLDINKDDLSKVIKNTFLMENNALLRNKQIDSDLSGSTCISVIYTPKKLIIANVGDSRCVLGSRVEGEWEYTNLSRDHKPSIREEAERIIKSGGRIRPMIDEDGCFVGPLRVYMKDKDLPGLAMTRSFGDYFARIAGTIAEPEIKEHILVPEDKFIILASDGLFEFMSSEEVGNIVKGYYEKNDIVGCCEYLYKESYRKWISEEEDTVDDITIILVFFEE